MANFNVATIFKGAQVFVSKHSPEILTGIGLLGMAGTVITAVKATPKAIELIEQKKAEQHVDKLHPVEVIKTAWKCYIPPFIMGVTSAACLIKANSITLRQNAALATAYNLSKTALNEYKEKVVETIGEKKEQMIYDEISKDKLKKDPVKSSEVVITERGNTLCYDSVFGRYFRSDMDTIKRAINEINHRIVTGDMYASLNDFYDLVGLPSVDIGDELGWNIDDRGLEVHFSSQIAADDTPCLVVGYNIAPKYNYYNFFS